MEAPTPTSTSNSTSQFLFGITNQDHVLITGSAGGIGVMCARMYLEYTNAKVTLQFHSHEASLSSLLQKYPNRTLSVKADCREETSVVEAVKTAVSHLGPITILIANHAIFTPQVPISEMSLGQWKNTLDVNLTGVFLFTREYLRQLKSYATTLSKSELNELNANVVFVGSAAAEFPIVGHADYSSSKGAIMYGFMRSLKNEIVKIVPRGRCNTVEPGWTLTEMAEKSIKQGEHFSALQTTPLKKIATVEDVSNAILFLSSKKLSGHTTGAILPIHGGMEGHVMYSLEDLHQ